MRTAERFLTSFAVLSVIMRLAGMKDAPTLELIALPSLALFYLIFMPFLVHGSLSSVMRQRRGIFLMIAGALAGGCIAYCIISLLMYTLTWLPRADMLVNCCIILGLVCIASFICWRRRSGDKCLVPGIRAAILLGIILIVAALPLPQIGALSNGAF